MTDREGTDRAPDTEPGLGDVFEAVTGDAKAYMAAQKALITLDLSERGGRIAAKAVWLVVAVLLVGLGMERPRFEVSISE
ncbi:MAG TPA: hypothetical protein PLN54_10575, partial [Flavobacteriales bacterium]|nr:hypothetical protein [Flavobacteriales bacterium]